MGCPNLDDARCQRLVLADVIGWSRYPAVRVGRCRSLEKEGSRAHPPVCLHFLKFEGGPFSEVWI